MLRFNRLVVCLVVVVIAAVAISSVAAASDPGASPSPPGAEAGKEPAPGEGEAPVKAVEPAPGVAGQPQCWPCPCAVMSPQRLRLGMPGVPFPGGPQGGERLAKGLNRLLGRVAEALELTPEQKEKLAKLRTEAAATYKVLSDLMTEKTQEFRKQWTKDDPDKARLKTLAGDMLDLRLRMRRESEKIQDRVKQILTPEQQKKLAQIWQKAQRRLPGFGQMGGRGWGRGRGRLMRPGW